MQLLRPAGSQRLRVCFHAATGLEERALASDLYWRGLLTAVSVSAVSLGLGARYLLRQMTLSPAMLLRSGE